MHLPQAPVYISLCMFLSKYMLLVGVVPWGGISARVPVCPLGNAYVHMDRCAWL